jgi:hypothetical protein
MKSPTLWLTTALLALGFIATGCIPDQITEFDFKALQPDSNPIPSPFTRNYNLSDGSQNAEISILGGIQWGTNSFESEQALALPVTESQSRIAAEGVHYFYEPQQHSFFLLPEPTFAQEFPTNINQLNFGGMTMNLNGAAIRDTLWLQLKEIDGTPFAFCWEKPLPSLTGEQDIQFRLFYWENSSWKPVNDAVLNLYPYMDMGGGDGHSTPFQKPIFIGNGAYKGMINYIMSGGWELTLIAQIPENDEQHIRFSPFYVYTK